MPPKLQNHKGEVSDRSLSGTAAWANQDPQSVVLWREHQRVSLRAFIRSLLHNPQFVNTKAVQEFLSTDPITPTDEDVDDIERRKLVDEQRIEEQKRFYEIARKRAAELDEYMEQ